EHRASGERGLWMRAGRFRTATPLPCRHVRLRGRTLRSRRTGNRPSSLPGNLHGHAHAETWTAVVGVPFAETQVHDGRVVGDDDAGNRIEDRAGEFVQIR